MMVMGHADHVTKVAIHNGRRLDARNVGVVDGVRVQIGLTGRNGASSVQ